ncbi:MAG: hypothetical protein PHX93_05910 [Candidatus Peribacteraceae bacterium]|jgi:hypothetical protein|nr:hypothetical protein [Candidatus Peribacteraceae bacterium]
MISPSSASTGPSNQTTGFPYTAGEETDEEEELWLETEEDRDELEHEEEEEEEKASELELFEELTAEEELPPHVTVTVTVDQTAPGGAGEVCRDWAATLCVMIDPQVCEEGTW